MSELGIKFMGKDPNGIAKSVNVDATGNVIIQSNRKKSIIDENTTVLTTRGLFTSAEISVADFNSINVNISCTGSRAFVSIEGKFVDTYKKISEKYFYTECEISIDVSSFEFIKLKILNAGRLTDTYKYKMLGVKI